MSKEPIITNDTDTVGEPQEKEVNRSGGVGRVVKANPFLSRRCIEGADCSCAATPFSCI